PMTPEAHAAADALASGRCAAPFDVLGIHPLRAASEAGRVVRCFIPWAGTVTLLRPGAAPRALERVTGEGLFEVVLPRARTFFPYRLRVEDAAGATWEVEDPYRFLPALDEARAGAFLRGEEARSHQVLGAHVREHQGVRGTLFAVWAPHARAVGVMGDMNGWDARCHPMRPRGALGMWELFVPGVEAGARYKYRILTAGGEWVEKADPFGRASELRPATASRVWDDAGWRWGDGAWMEARGRRDADRQPMSVYEVHAGSWRRHPRGAGETGWLSYRELADQLIPYVGALGFTHIELLPLQEHPLDQSWGYQAVGFFAPTSRFGTPDDFRYLVDRAHRAGIGVILDWVPGHFPTDAHGLARFDGTPLYEHPDPLQAWHPDWGTLTFNYGSAAVRAFLISSALHWLEDYHVDGLRVDAVASMLYLDYSRPDGQWRPNVHGGRENLEAVAFLRELNDAVHSACPGALMIAEESTSWAGVSHGTDRGGLGFDQKWNMGWMNDTLAAFATDPLYRKWRYDKFTFSLMYAFAERFVLPFSHDEVVHGKGSLAGKMPGPQDEKLANLRALLAYQWAHPGKKLLFMGGELGQWAEWNVDGQLDWALLQHPTHQGIGRLVGDLNRVYREEPALHTLDFQPQGFEWLDCHDAGRVTLSFVRWSPKWEDFVAVVANLTPVPRPDFVLPVPWPGRYRVILNSAAPVYGGSGGPLPEAVDTRPERRKERDHVLDLPLPGLAVLYLKPLR
ncbi:MAG: 1,4-alpha-glucan branching protein GlgB, partial [Longimicrobiales bacterium]|nr:1,4-alpha-glucan branching protein GlgB [Longimicrobiales bacterium]